MLWRFAQGLPPIPDPNTLDLSQLLANIGLAVLWTVVASICFGVAISIGIRLLQALLPELDAIQELKRGNQAVAIFSAAFLVSLTVVVVAILLK
jgi:hypothetical protein